MRSTITASTPTTMTLRGCELPLLLLLTGCAPRGDWALTGSGPLIEGGIPSTAMADGCSVDFERFLISWDGRFIERGRADPVGEIVGAQVYDFAQPGPHDLGTAQVLLGEWDRVFAILQPSADATAGNVDAATASEIADAGVAMRIEGTVTCPGSFVAFRWDVDRMIKHHCFAEEVITQEATATTAFTVAGERLFSTALEDPSAPMRGQIFVDADVDGSGDVSLAELEQVRLQDVGYDDADWNLDSLDEFIVVQTFSFLQTDGSPCRPERLGDPYIAR